MQTPTRRQMLAACGGTTLGALAGCATLGSITDQPSDEPTCPDNPGVESPSSDVYISAVVAAQTESDDVSLNQETVLIETTDAAPTDLSGYALVYCGRAVYEFPDLVSDVQPGADLQIHSGSGENGVDTSAPPEYSLFVDSETELLANDGMALAIRAANNEVIDSIAYPSLAPGQRWVRPE